MLKKNFRGGVALLGVCVVFGASLVGCAAPPKNRSLLEEQLTKEKAQVSVLESELKSKESALKTAQKNAERATREAETAREMAKQAESQRSLASPASVNPNEDMLPQASAGECYARVLIPPVYETTSEQALKKDGQDRLSVVPGKYEWAEEDVLVKPARKEIQVIPAQYETVTDRVLVTPARTYWKKGRGPVETVDNATGEIMCLIEEPAVYSNVTKRVLKSRETTREVEIPADYKTIKVKREITPPSTKTVSVPAEYQTITKRTMVKPSRLEWRPILCETNAQGNVVMNIQRALKAKGHDPGSIDGILGSQTHAAVRSFQMAEKLPTGALTFATMQALGVQYSSRR